ncbi:MAG TPA: DUF3570 domain-containing protein [Cyclobacteriaceae bacterium]|nr:DUF3570 domain-containing protein [Cyclobacteriaceae bacterium]
MHRCTVKERWAAGAARPVAGADVISLMRRFRLFEVFASRPEVRRLLHGMEFLKQRNSNLKKRYLIIPLLAASLSTFAQRKDNGYMKKKLAVTDVAALFSYYTQDNNHSAVTGGKGTEDLQVYSAQTFVDLQRDSANTYHINAGVDVISSASTDNIDYEVSSASKEDFRAYMKIGYDHKIKRTGYTMGFNGAFSLESDYMSYGVGGFLSHASEDQSREWSAMLQCYFDDLRWYDHGNHDILVYPVELRDTEWFDIYRRNSYNFSFAFSQVLNPKMSLGVYPGVSYQSGLLSTPFHRVYFRDDTERVENLPQSRLRIPIGIQLNSFIGSRLIVRTYYRFYWDDYGMNAHTINIESAFKINPVLTVIPFIRVYRQSATDYFKPYAHHNPLNEFYTSDYDLSQFESYKPGIGLRYAPFIKKGRMIFKEVELRYAFYKRSDGLTANMISLFIDGGVERKRKNADLD